MKKRALLFLLLLAAGALPATAVGYSFRHITSRDGLSSNSVRAIVQDHLGLVWVGTAVGLDSFDGRDAIHHDFPDGESGTVLVLFEDSRKTLWIGADCGLFRYDGISVVRVPEIPRGEVTGLTEDRDGGLWVGMWGKGVFRLSGDTVSGYLDGHQVEAIISSEDGRLWVADASAGEGLMVYNSSSLSFESPGLSFQGCTPTRVCAMEEDGDGNLWLGTWNLGLYRMDAATRTVRCAVPPEKGLNHIHSLTRDGARNLLVGSDDGLLHLDPQTGEQTLYRNDRNDPASLSDQFVYPVTRDHEGGLWIGTYYGGVNYVAPHLGQFTTRSLSGLLGAEERFVVSCFCEDPDGTLWIGSDNGGLFRYDPVRDAAVQWSATRGWSGRLSALNVHALLREEDDLWIGTYSDNLLRLNLKTGLVREYGQDEGLDAPSVYGLCLDAGGTLWAGTSSGICRYDAASDRFVEERAAGDWVMDIQADAEGSLWFATSRSGVLRRKSDGSWQTFTTADNGLPSNYINCLTPAPQGVFAGTQNGLVLLSADGGAKTLMTGEDILRIASDGNQLWLSTASSIVRYFLADGRRESFGANDGITSSLFSTNAGTVTRDGRIYMGAADGFVSFFPGVKGNDTPPPVLFTRFHASGPGLFMDAFQNGSLGHIVLPWRMRDIYISFAALSYEAPEKIRFAYRLEGLDPEWKQIGNQNFLSLNKLPAGRYRLQLTACNNSGVWNTEGATLSFTVRPHPLLSNVALILYVLLVGILFWLLGRWYLKRKEEESKARYEQQLDAAVSLLKEEERDDRVQLLTSLADQLEAPLTGIGVQLDRIKEEPRVPQAVKGGLSVIEKNHRMLRSLSASLQQMRAALSLREGKAPETEERVPDREEDFLLKLDRIIAENVANPELSVGFLAKEMAISRSGLFAKVKELCGETPNNLINQARLNKAAALLSEGRYSVGEICYMTGFSSPSYFSKSFLNQFGVSPHDWARTHQS
ncbi:MAG: helix-turn-helix domain-containing protein [Bacteroidales bacterium]|nr:helix-turn-helix domain-containing protein [Bacteroidales bacterium]